MSNHTTPTRWLPGDIVSIAAGVYRGVHGVIDSVTEDEFGIDVAVLVTDAPKGLLLAVPAGHKQFVHVDPHELCS